MKPTLLVLAAGLGSRYGGLKQLDSVGPSGETILDYAVYDALRAGFGRVVFVIRRDFEKGFREKVSARFEGTVPVDIVFQSLDLLPDGFSPPAGREKPWGTGHAVWCARDTVKTPFAVVGADDFFGADAFIQLGKFLVEAKSGEKPPHAFAMVGYRLDRTLSEHGTVSRGVCDVSADGLLRNIEERAAISPESLAASGLRGDETVSMNCFGFTPALFPALDGMLRDFLTARGLDESVEFYLPSAVSAMIARSLATIRVLPTTGEWFGVTHREEKPRVIAAIAALVTQGRYPRKLF